MGSSFSPFERDGIPVLEADFEFLAVAARRGRPLVDLLARHVARFFEIAALDGAAPEVGVDRPDALVAALDGQVALGSVLDLPVAGHPQLADGRDDFEIRSAPDGLEAELVVALAGTAVGDTVAIVLLGDAKDRLRDHRSC
jgi:hypothetical protein